MQKPLIFEGKPKIVVAICSVGRSDCLEEMLPYVSRQSLTPYRVIISITKQEDMLFDPNYLFSKETDVKVIIGDKGLTKQRNKCLTELGEGDFVVFFDDDYLPSRYSLEGVVNAFIACPDANAITGLVLADGINNAGLSKSAADALIDRWDSGSNVRLNVPNIISQKMEGLYGCNMAYRASEIGHLQFDERLPLYAWQEDIDFAAQVRGEKIKIDSFAGVHLGTKKGRETSGLMLGYSQVVNPWYLCRKGTMSRKFARKIVFRNFIANHLKILNPEPWVDRYSRMKGNWLALYEIMLGRATPERILDI